LVDSRHAYDEADRELLCTPNYLRPPIVAGPFASRWLPGLFA